jgi:hypothetical protein
LAEDRARALESRLNEIAAHLQQQGKKPDFFDNPEEAANRLILQALQPVVTEQRNQAMYNSRLVAGVVHGVDKVSAAEQAFLEAKNNNTLDPMDYERVVQSPNRYDAAVQWHKRQTVLSSVGDDPEAFFEKHLETRMSDPKFQAALMERVRGSAASRPSETRLPPSLSRSTAAAGNAEGAVGDMSDQSLFRYAMSKGRPQ